MNVFDFDKTIYNGDSTKDFVIFCMKKHKRAILYLPRIGISTIMYYLLHIGDKTAHKERMYGFLRACGGERDVEEFWASRPSKIKPFYLKMQQPDDVVISASPEFLLKPLEKKYGFTVIASKVDVNTGRYDGKNCYYEEKVKRFHELYPDAEIDEFYSDSYSDEPLARLAKRAFVVDGDTITEWDHSKHKKHIRT